jgi:hypothetical protein
MVMATTTSTRSPSSGGTVFSLPVGNTLSCQSLERFLDVEESFGRSLEEKGFWEAKLLGKFGSFVGIDSAI